MKKRPTDVQLQLLGEMLFKAFIELRALGWQGKAEQAADLADAFHNLPIQMFSDSFDWDLFSNSYLAAYQEKYPNRDFFYHDYVAMLDKIKNEV